MPCYRTCKTKGSRPVDTSRLEGNALYKPYVLMCGRRVKKSAERRSSTAIFTRPPLGRPACSQSTYTIIAYWNCWRISMAMPHHELATIRCYRGSYYCILNTIHSIASRPLDKCIIDPSILQVNICDRNVQDQQTYG